MKAVTWHGVGDIRLEDVPKPTIEQQTDAIIRVTTSAICGTDLHMVRGTMSGMVPGTILGHEAVGVVESVGRDVRNFQPGDRVVVASTIACGYCSYCRSGYFSQCDNANPNGPQAGTSFFGGPKETGPVNGLQAEFARIPFANVTMVKLPDTIPDEKAILISDILPTGYMAAEMAEICSGDTVAVFGCGIVGQMAIASARMMGAGRIIAVDAHEDRLDIARSQGAETVNFDQEDPVATIKTLTGGIGVDRVIDAVGIDAEAAHSGPAASQNGNDGSQEVAGGANGFTPGDAPTQVIEWAIQSLAKAGTHSIIGVYPPTLQTYPIGMAMNKNLTLKAGNCNHRAYIPKLIDLVASGAFDPTRFITHTESFTSVIDTYKAFDARQPGWLKVQLEGSARAA